MTTNLIERDHASMVLQLAKPGSDILNEMTPKQAHLLHMAVGIAGEAGELLDAIKKHCVYQKELDYENVVEELGDLEFYMEGLRNELSILRVNTLTHNLNKLAVRYEGYNYTNEAAHARADKNGE